ncbi:MAG: 50S ribosomal protein L24 [Candidatus Omnitrophica bacterium]|nr:50S ribosomal protein L24 [Candidatus Omnitrophota bacterium]
MKLKKNDTVSVLTGRDRGKKGKILKLYPEKQTAIVEHVNMVKKHMRRTQANPKGGIVVREGSVKISNLMLVCPRCSKTTRVAFMLLTDGSKKRMCRKCKEII